MDNCYQYLLAQSCKYWHLKVEGTVTFTGPSGGSADYTGVKTALDVYSGCYFNEEARSDET